MNEIYDKGRMNGLIHLINKYDCKLGLEIGVKEGLSSYEVLERTKINVLFGLDIKITKNAYDFQERYFPRYFAIEGDSTKVYPFFSQFKFDYVYLDGGHDYETVKADIKNYYPLLRKGGVLAFDDYEIVTYDGNEVCGVVLAIGEFARKSEKTIYLNTKYEGPIQELEQLAAVRSQQLKEGKTLTGQWGYCIK